jgi:hypothetical protein
MTIITKWKEMFKHMISWRCSSWTCTSQTSWKSPFTSSSYGYMEFSSWCMPIERYINPHRNTTPTDHGLVHKVQSTISYHTTWDHFIPLGKSSTPCVFWSIWIHYLHFVCIELVSFVLSSSWWCIERKRECSLTQSSSSSSRIAQH